MQIRQPKRRDAEEATRGERKCTNYGCDPSSSKRKILFVLRALTPILVVVSLCTSCIQTECAIKRTHENERRLNDAIGDDDVDTVKRYIRAKGESDEIWNSAVLSYAAISGSGRVLTYLVQERGVDVNAIYNGHTLFEWAIEAGYEREPWLRHLAPRYVYPENPQMAICVALLHNLNRSFSSKYALYMLLNEKDPSSDIADLLKSSYGMRILPGSTFEMGKHEGKDPPVLMVSVIVKSYDEKAKRGVVCYRCCINDNIPKTFRFFFAEYSVRWVQDTWVLTRISGGEE